MPQLSQENLLSVQAGACQPRGGVPRYLAADLDLIFCNKNTKNNSEFVLDSVQTTAQDNRKR